MRRALPVLVLGTMVAVGCSSARNFSTGPSDVPTTPTPAPQQLLSSADTTSPFVNIPVVGTYSGGNFAGKYSVVKFLVDVMVRVVPRPVQQLLGRVAVLARTLAV